jgi:hypothetical protein
MAGMPSSVDHRAEFRFSLSMIHGLSESIYMYVRIYVCMYVCVCVYIYVYK